MAFILEFSSSKNNKTFCYVVIVRESHFFFPITTSSKKSLSWKY